MVVELEQEIMKEIGFGQEWSWYQGSRDCVWIRARAIEALPNMLKKRGMKLADSWEQAIRQANAADAFRSHEGDSLVNVWKTISYAIQDAIYRKEGGEEAGLEPKMDFVFFDKATKDRWEEMMEHQRMFEEKGDIRPRK